MTKFVQFWKDETGATAIEYAMIAGTTALVLIATMPLLKSSLGDQFTSVADGM